MTGKQNHDIFGVASKDNHAFGVKQIRQIFFILAFASDEEGGQSGGQSQTGTQTTLAGKLPSKALESSHCVVKTWAVKWSPQGLAPVRPLVLFKQSCDLAADKALSLM